jgi:hypothetical protein
MGGGREAEKGLVLVVEPHLRRPLHLRRLLREPRNDELAYLRIQLTVDEDAENDVNDLRRDAALLDGPLDLDLEPFLVKLLGELLASPGEHRIVGSQDDESHSEAFLLEITDEGVET